MRRGWLALRPAWLALKPAWLALRPGWMGLRPAWLTLGPSRGGCAYVRTDGWTENLQDFVPYCCPKTRKVGQGHCWPYIVLEWLVLSILMRPFCSRRLFVSDARYITWGRWSSFRVVFSFFLQSRCCCCGDCVIRLEGAAAHRKRWGTSSAPNLHSGQVGDGAWPTRWQ